VRGVYSFPRSSASGAVISSAPQCTSGSTAVFNALPSASHACLVQVTALHTAGHAGLPLDITWGGKSTSLTLRVWFPGGDPEVRLSTLFNLRTLNNVLVFHVVAVDEARSQGVGDPR
jgi:hypothetical protein